VPTWLYLQANTALCNHKEDISVKSCLKLAYFLHNRLAIA
jgi:hypothetical protein